MGVLGQAGLRGVWFDRLTRDARCGLVVGCRWVPDADSGMTTGALAGGAERVQAGECLVGVGAAAIPGFVGRTRQRRCITVDR